MYNLQCTYFKTLILRATPIQSGESCNAGLRSNNKDTDSFATNSMYKEEKIIVGVKEK
jgi:hypothetical protein